MKLGGSLARRRRSRRDKSRGPIAGASNERRGQGRYSRLWFSVLMLTLLGWFGGYLITTQFIFPPPSPPGDFFEVPDIRGGGLATARERLTGAGLVLGEIDSLLHPSVPEALIIGQSPLPGQVLRPESQVRVTVSLGPQLRSVPDVLGLTEDRAQIVLESSGFIVSMDTAEADLPRGSVLEVFPPPDTIIPLPAEVLMIVSTGPALVAMPLVLGLDREEALVLLDSLGLVVSEIAEVFRFGRDQGVVVEQEPASEIELERGAEVRLKVGMSGGVMEQ